MQHLGTPSVGGVDGKQSTAPVSDVVDVPANRPADQAYENEGNEQGQAERSWWGNPEVWIAVFTGLLFLVTFALARYTYRLWKETQRLASDASKATESSLKISKVAADARRTG